MNQKTTFIKNALTAFLGLVLSFSGVAQVTSSVISGTISDSKKEGLPGATVLAIHIPSGSKYTAISDINGRYVIPSVRVGGPFKVSVSFVGFKNQAVEGVITNLGTAANVNFSLSDDNTTLDELVVRTNKSDVFSSDRTGASTNIDSEQLKNMPTISRSINDFTRLNPQAGNGSSFGGRDGRYNNITIDGANFNNNFGLSSSNLPGGSAQPISLDAIEEVQVNIAPYDVRQANFTGAGVNVITKSGTNQLKGTAYTYYRNENFNGSKVGDLELPAAAKTTNNIYGASIGGPIIKDKVFLFVNGEYEKNVRPGFNWVASRPGLTGDNVSRTTATDLETVSNFLEQNYNYETGPYEGYGDNFTLKNFKFVTRLDWNINQNHKFNVRFSKLNNTDDNIINGTSAPNPRSASNRLSQNSMTYENSNYGFMNNVTSLAAELNSNFGGKFSNQFLSTYTFVEDTRTSKSTDFPFVDIKKDGDSYISFGYELFSKNNNVKNTTLNFINNITYYAGKHNILAGVAYEQMYFANSFLRYGTSYYRFNSMEDFLTKKTPAAFAYTYSLVPGMESPAAELTFGQASAYIQDVYSVRSNFTLTAGIRMDLPVYPVTPIENPTISAINFLNSEKIVTGSWPKSKPAFSPRIGFNWNLKEKGLQVRGGTGIFNGRIPFVWFTNQATNSGVLQNTFETIDASVLANYQFDPNPKAHLDKLPKNAPLPSSLASVSPDFKMPQIFRTNIGIDKTLPGNASISFEGIYSNDLVTIYQRNINLNNPIGKLSGPDTRPLYSSSTRRVVSNITEAMVLDNTRKGGGVILTTELKKRAKNFFGSIAYTFNNIKDLTGNPGSQAASAWSGNRAVGSLNELPLAMSQYSVPHRVVSSLSYNLQYLKHLSTTFSLFYEGTNQGRFSYVYNGDLNQDGINGADLLYIPANANEIIFSNIVSAGVVKYTAAAQSEAFFKYLEQDKYLSKNQGKYAEANGALLPWLNRFDFRVLQDFHIKSSGYKNTLQLSLDILNVGNLINSGWGIAKRLNANNGAILRYASLNASGQPVFQMAEAGGKLVAETFQNIPAASNTWGAQVGLRYIFN